MRKARLAGLAAVLFIVAAQQGCTLLLAAAAVAATVAPFVDNSKPAAAPTHPQLDDKPLVD